MWPVNDDMLRRRMCISLEWKPDGDNNKGTLETTRKSFSLI